MEKKTIALDFDGVVNSYKSGWSGGMLPDPPNEGAFDFIRELVRTGHEVVIYSTRAQGPAIAHMRVWLKTHGLEESIVQGLCITNRKPMAILYIDDRALRFTGAWPSMKEVDALGANPGMDPLQNVANPPSPLREPSVSGEGESKSKKKASKSS